MVCLCDPLPLWALEQSTLMSEFCRSIFVSCVYRYTLRCLLTRRCRAIPRRAPDLPSCIYWPLSGISAPSLFLVSEVNCRYVITEYPTRMYYHQCSLYQSPVHPAYLHTVSCTGTSKLHRKFSSHSCVAAQNTVLITLVFRLARMVANWW